MQRSKTKLMISWLLWALWTILLCFLFLAPSEGTAVRDISLFFGGSELTDAIGHVVMIFVETALLYNVLRHYKRNDTALQYAVGVTLVFGLCAELAQHWIPSRGASLIDVCAAFIGVVLFAFVIRKKMWIVRFMENKRFAK
jgi:hypothetical protein